MAQDHFDVDFMSTRGSATGFASGRSGRSSHVGLLLLLTGAVLAALAGDHWLDATAQRADMQDTLARLQQAQQRLAAPTPAQTLRRRAAAGDARLQAVGQAAVQADLTRIAADLHRPWWPLLDTLERRLGASTPLMQLGVDPAFKTAQLQVQAGTLNDVLQLVQRLDGAAPPLRAAQLLGHEWVGGGDAAAAGATGPRQLVARIVLTLDGGGRP